MITKEINFIMIIYVLIMSIINYYNINKHFEEHNKSLGAE